MSDERAGGQSTKRVLDRRTLLAGGASTVAAGVLAQAGFADEIEHAEITPLIGMTVAERPSRDSFEGVTVETDDRVQVEVSDGARVANRSGRTALTSFAPGSTVAVILAQADEDLDIDNLNAQGQVDAVAVVELVLGKRSDIRRP